MEEDKLQLYAVYTKPNREEIVADYLKNAGLEVFNPKNLTNLDVAIRSL